MKILSIFVAFLENMNFIILQIDIGIGWPIDLFEITVIDNPIRFEFHEIAY